MTIPIMQKLDSYNHQTPSDGTWVDPHFDTGEFETCFTFFQLCPEFLPIIGTICFIWFWSGCESENNLSRLCV